jgi:hypothetical protein
VASAAWSASSTRRAVAHGRDRRVERERRGDEEHDRGHELERAEHRAVAPRPRAAALR